jgi:hypothetical protein
MYQIFTKCYRQPMYLKRSPKILIKMLSKTLNHTFKEKVDEKFICIRLDLFDRFYCLRIGQQLWESYLDIGLQQHLWPVSFILNYLSFKSIFFSI